MDAPKEILCIFPDDGDPEWYDAVNDWDYCGTPPPGHIDYVRKDIVDHLKDLADAMYSNAQYLTTDASRLRKAMEEYKHYIDYEYLKDAKQKLFEKQ